MGVASLILGIIALVFCVIVGTFGLGWIGSICGLIAIILGAIAAKKGDGKGNAGLVLGIIALAYGIIATIACLTCLSACGLAGAELFGFIVF